MSTESAHEASEAASATKKTKNEGDMLRSQNNKKDQVEEDDDEMKALIEERRNIRKEDKEQMKHVSKKIKKMYLRQKNQQGTNRFSEYWRSLRESRTFRTSNVRRKEYSHQR